MERDEKTLQELIAERKRIDNLISSYQKAQEELVTTTGEGATYSPKGYSFEDLVENSLKNDELVCTRELIPCNIRVINKVINVDNSIHVTNNHMHDTHNTTTLTLGDSAISMLGNLLSGLFE